MSWIVDNVEIVEKRKYVDNLAYSFPEHFTDEQKISSFVKSTLSIVVQKQQEIEILKRKIKKLKDPNSDYSVAKSLSERIYDKDYSAISDLLSLMQKEDLDPSSHSFIASALCVLKDADQITQVVIPDIIDFSYLENLHTESYSKVAKLLIFICHRFKTSESKKALIDFYSNKYTECPIDEDREKVVVNLLNWDTMLDRNEEIDSSFEKFVIDFCQNKDLVDILLKIIRLIASGKASMFLIKLIASEILSIEEIKYIDRKVFKLRVENIEAALYDFAYKNVDKYPDYFKQKRVKFLNLIYTLFAELVKNIQQNKKMFLNHQKYVKKGYFSDIKYLNEKHLISYDTFFNKFFNNNCLLISKNSQGTEEWDAISRMMRTIIDNNLAKNLYSDNRFPDVSILPLLEVFIRLLQHDIHGNNNDIIHNDRSLAIFQSGKDYNIKQLNEFIDFVLAEKMQSINPSIFAKQLRFMINNLSDEGLNIPESVQTFEEKLQEEQDIDLFDRLTYLRKEKESINGSTTLKIVLLVGGGVLEISNLHKLII